MLLIVKHYFRREKYTGFRPTTRKYYVQFNQLFNSGTVRARKAVRDWQEAVHLTGQLLVDKGSVARLTSTQWNGFYAIWDLMWSSHQESSCFMPVRRMESSNRAWGWSRSPLPSTSVTARMIQWISCSHSVRWTKKKPYSGTPTFASFGQPEQPDQLALSAK